MPIIVDFTLEEFEELLKDHENPDTFITAFYRAVVLKCGIPEEDWLEGDGPIRCTEVVCHPDWNIGAFELMKEQGKRRSRTAVVDMRWMLAWMNAGPSNTNSHPGIQVGPDQLHCTDKAFTWLQPDQTEPS